MVRSEQLSRDQDRNGDAGIPKIGVRLRIRHASEAFVQAGVPMRCR
jgi:hypothetical protein